MKTLPLLVLLFTATCAFSQNGKIAVKNPSSDPEGKTTFVYEPPSGIFLPEEVVVNVSCRDIQRKTIPLEKNGSVYEFSMKLPAKSTVLFFSVCDTRNIAVDNNSGKGYVVYLKDPDTEGFEQTLLEEIQSAGMTSYYLKLDYTPEDMLNAYESLFASYPEMRNESAYTTYLVLKFHVNKGETRPELIAYAEQMAGKDDEESLSAAYGIYRTLQMNDKMDEVAIKALEKYPKGEVAKDNFLEDYYSVRERDETYISNKIEEYVEFLGDPQDPNLDMLYYELILMYLNNKDTLSVAKYKDQITNKNLWVSIYNSYAWSATGGDLTSPGMDLDLAAQFSKESLDIIKYLMEHPEENTEGYDQEGRYQMCADTYALVLYKQKKYDQAFQYQHEILEAVGDGMGTDGKERYAAFAEKAKGPEYARDYLEKQLLAGTDSKVMVEQLNKIYEELNLPEDEFEKIRMQYKESAAQKDRDEIIEKYGDIKALDFTLTNLDDENITLSDYTGKVVILDFWATWCGPCLASFPEMQELVNQFQNSDVEFFFINSAERQEPDQVKEKVVELMKEKGYHFNVLFDYNDEVINMYKVQAIPTRFLIDKSGNMRAIVRYTDDLAAMISEGL